jgi:hypothetical protein
MATSSGLSNALEYGGGMGGSSSLKNEFSYSPIPPPRTASDDPRRGSMTKNAAEVLAQLGNHRELDWHQDQAGFTE